MMTFNTNVTCKYTFSTNDDVTNIIMLKLVFMLGFIKVSSFRMIVAFHMMTYICN